MIITHTQTICTKICIFIFTPVTVNLHCDILYTQPVQAMHNNSIQIKVYKNFKTMFELVNMITPNWCLKVCSSPLCHLLLCEMTVMCVSCAQN